MRGGTWKQRGVAGAGRADARGDADPSRLDAGRWPCTGEMGLGMEGQEEHQDLALGTATSGGDPVHPPPLPAQVLWQCGLHSGMGCRGAMGFAGAQLHVSASCPSLAAGFPPSPSPPQMLLLELPLEPTAGGNKPKPASCRAGAGWGFAAVPALREGRDVALWPQPCARTCQYCPGS